MIDDKVSKAEEVWRDLCDENGKETMEMAEPRDLFQMGFNFGHRAAIAAMEADSE